MPLLRHAALGVAAALSTIPLASCGFTPLYASNTLTQSLTGVEVEGPPHSRAGYLIHQAIDDELGRDRASAPRYRLVFDLREGRAPRGVRVNNVASRYELTLTTIYALKDAESGALLTTGAFITQTSYDSVDAPFAGLSASQDGEVRAAQQAAVRLRLELSRYINGHPYHQLATAAGRKERYAPKAGAPTLSSDPDAEGEARTDRGADASQPAAPLTGAPATGAPAPGVPTAPTETRDPI